MFFRPANQLEIDFALAATGSSKGSHSRLEVVLHRLDFAEDSASLGGQLGRYLVGEVENFFWALYSVVASVTR